MNTLPETIASRIEHCGDCWIFTGATNSRGYGSITDGNGSSLLAHRVAYESTFGPIPDGLTIDHVAERGCKSKQCVNPRHLEVVTRGENSRRARRTQTHCKNGHPLSGENLRTRRRQDGYTYRICRACAAEQSRQSRARRKPIAQFYGEAAA